MGVWKGLDEGGQPVVRYFAPAEEAHARAMGFQPAAPDEAAASTGAIDDRTGGALGAVGAAASSALAGTTLGASDAAFRALLGEAGAGRIAADRAEHPWLSGAASTAGAVLPSVLGATALPAGAAARLGSGVADAAGGGFVGAAAGAGAEGALYGLGQGVSDLSLSKDPLTLEHAASTLSSNMLYGAGFGAAGGVAFHGLVEGMSAAKGAIDDALISRSADRAMKAVGELDAAAASEPATITPETDLTLLNKEGLKAAREQEAGTIEKARAPERQQFARDMGEFYNEMADQKLSKVASGTGDAEARRAGAALRNADTGLRRITDNEAGLAEKPERALNALQTQRQALEDLREFVRTEQTDYFKRIAAAREDLSEKLVAGKLEGYAKAAELTPVGRDLAVRQELERQHGAVHNDVGQAVLPERISVQRYTQIEEALEKNQVMQARVARLTAEPVSERLMQIEAAEHALGSRTAAPTPVPQESPIGMLLKAAGHAAGPLGTVASTAVGALGVLRKAAGAAAERAGRAASGFLGTAVKGATKAPSAAPVLATRVLAQLRYGEPAEGDKKRPSTLPDLYRARTDEIKRQVQIAPDGTFQMRADARQKMAAKLVGVGAVDPRTADRLESAGAERIAWLASQIPRRPDIAGMQVGPDAWHPSDLEMRTWARKAAAADDPQGVLERVIHGQVTPEDAQTMRALYPDMLQAFVQTVSVQLPTLRQTLPYKQKLSLSLFSGVPVDPALDPKILSFLQSQFADEHGTAGGTSAPKPSPQFGSIKKSPDAATPAQARAQGTHL